jgi:hypothetical protein
MVAVLSLYARLGAIFTAMEVALKPIPLRGSIVGDQEGDQLGEQREFVPNVSDAVGDGALPPVATERKIPIVQNAE